ncbi:MAG: hypothetical protein Q9O62_02985 [Ardenticatenia bacterium]|nr:hypothetical protein [Ardenticatenia bacterium]
MLATLLAMREIVRLVAPITGGGGGLDLPPELNRTQEYHIALAPRWPSVGTHAVGFATSSASASAVIRQR